MKFRAMPITVAVIAVLGIAYVGYKFVRDSARSEAFEKVTPGMATAEVEKLLGHPEERLDGCRDNPPSWQGDPVAGECSFHFVYQAEFGPRFWTIGFNQAGRAMAKYEYVSP